MRRTYLPALLASLCACTTTNSLERGSDRPGPTFSGFLPAPQQNPEAPDDTTLPVGLGLTAGPTTFLVGGTLDFPLDKQITVGPSLQYGIDDEDHLMTVTGQIKYFLKIEKNDKGDFPLLPYLTGGIGFASVDRAGKSGETGLVLNAGGGVRYLTGKHYRLGSEGRINVLPDSLSGESSYFSFELLQVVITF